MSEFPTYTGGSTMPKQYRTPKRGEIKAPNLDYLTANEVGAIKKLTGVDPFDTDNFGQTTALLGWWAAIKLPEYQGIPFATVCDWPLRCIDLITFDDDADDVTEAAQDLVKDDPELALDVINNGGEPEPPTTGQ